MTEDPTIPSSKDMNPGFLVEIMARLRSPEGCPWDREQTHQSLKPYLLEETYEVLEALDAQHPPALKEELGDLLLQILFHSQIASEKGHFTFADVCQTLAAKLIRRHPHVFDSDVTNNKIKTTSDVIKQWDELKQEEQRKKDQRTSHLHGIPKTSPALDRAYQTQKRAARAGFDWQTIEPVLEKFREELHELSTATEEMTRGAPDQWSRPSQPPERVEDELGDVLFSLVNLSRFLHVNPEEALRKSTNRFMRRFTQVERQAEKAGKTLKECSPQELDEWWESAKALEGAHRSNATGLSQQGDS